MTRKAALIIGNTQYADPQLSRLASPEADVQALADLLRSEQLGQFDEVTRLVNLTSSDASKQIERFFRVDKYPDDLLLFYFSGHGVLDDMSELYFACSDTDISLLDSTAVSGTYLRKAMDRSRSRRQVVILDCCNSGAFGPGAKAAVGSSVGTRRLVEDTPPPEPGEGRITLTASDVSEVAWEGDEIVGRPQRSVFTDVLLEGLRTGDADLDCDGWIAVDELYRYLVQNVGRRSGQRPRKFDNVQGQFYIGRRAAGTATPVKLDPRIAEDLLDDRPSMRLDGVNALGRWLRSQHMGRMARAELELKRIAETDDSDRVKAAAARILEESATESELTHAGERRVASGAAVSETSGRLGPDGGSAAPSPPGEGSTGHSSPLETKFAAEGRPPAAPAQAGSGSRAPSPASAGSYGLPQPGSTAGPPAGSRSSPTNSRYAVPPRYGATPAPPRNSHPAAPPAGHEPATVVFGLSARKVSIASLILGVVAVIFALVEYADIFGIVAGVVGLVLGIAARRQNQSMMGVAAIVLSMAGILIGIVTVLLYLAGMLPWQ